MIKTEILYLCISNNEQDMTIKGQATVVKHTGSHYLLSRLPQWNLFPAVLRGKIRLKDGCGFYCSPAQIKIYCK